MHRGTAKKIAWTATAGNVLCDVSLLKRSLHQVDLAHTWLERCCVWVEIRLRPTPLLSMLDKCRVEMLFWRN